MSKNETELGQMNPIGLVTVTQKYITRTATAGLAATSRLVMNFPNERNCSIHLVVGWPGRARHRRRWPSTAFVTDNTIPVGRRFCVHSVLRANE